MTETWLPVVGFEGLYEVSSSGGVRSITRFVGTKRGRIHRYAGVTRRILTNPRDRYLYVRLSKNGVVTNQKVHLLVIRAFIGPAPSDAHETCHWDGNRSNASISNLRWGTPSENAADRLRHGTDARGEKSPVAKLTQKNVDDIRGSAMTSTNLAAQLGVAASTVRSVRNRGNWAHS